MNSLFDSITIKGQKIKNRIVLPPMVCFGWGDLDGMVSELHIEHYAKIAEGGAGLIIVEATCIDKEGKLCDEQLGIWDDKHIEGLSKIASAIKKNGALALIQIHHAGRQTPETVVDIAVSASGSIGGERAARALSVEEIKELQGRYADAALRAYKAGFDGIELHGAHGYLISQFLSPITNKRTDQYGGEIENRLRFALEVISQVKARVPKDFIIGYRMGGNEPTIENGVIIAKALERAGVDLLHVSGGISTELKPEVPEGFQFNWIVYAGTQVKKNVNIPVITVNDIRTPERAGYLIENGLADFTAIGKGQLSDPYWARHAQGNEPINPCLKCKRCNWYNDGRKCPALKKLER